MKNFKYYLFVISFISCVLISCKENPDTKQLELQKRDSVLTEKERAFALKEAEYNALLKFKDSLDSTKDTVVINSLPVDISGIWTGKVVCTHSNCTDYVVGDVRTDEWELAEENGKIVAKNNNKTGVVRIYTGEYTGTNIVLSSQSAADAPTPRTFKIDLGTVSADRLSGTREIQVNNSCTSQFSIELVRK